MPIKPLLTVAEVLDKEPTLLLIWLVAVTLAVAGFAAARYKPLFLFLVLPVVVLAGLGILTELFDPFIGPAIRAGAGKTYVVQALLALFVTLAAPVVGLWSRRRARLT